VACVKTAPIGFLEKFHDAARPRSIAGFDAATSCIRHPPRADASVSMPGARVQPMGRRRLLRRRDPIPMPIERLQSQADLACSPRSYEGARSRRGR
jgi:hypothetical protein